ncbi:HMG1/2-like protein [Mercurialis annua]|uniref:HMG1/2-like protein n=1 Tax=Mercurialis annua TaxID=3986 RepID=UPI00215E40BD|nr:HMG1/2-like protein [Mercurialis annua]
MKGPLNVVVAHKKPEIMKARKAEAKAPKKKNSVANNTKDPNAPKRPASAFFVFMEEFRKYFKEKFPDNKAVAAVGKAGGEKWKSLTDAEKAPYAEKALKRKAEYETVLAAYKKQKLNGSIEKSEEGSEKSISEVHNEEEQEASS